ncbi:MAG: 50S ribosomal protein L10, partial [Patescibacteria group bacterium]
AGWVDGRFFTGEEIRSLAALPGRNALQAQLVGRLGGLIHRLVYNLNFPLRGLVFVTQAIAESKK